MHSRKTVPKPGQEPGRNDELLETVENQSVDGLMVIDADGVVQFANPAAKALFAGRTPAVIGFHFGYPAHEGSVELLLPGGEEMRHVEMRTSAIAWQGGAASLASLRDITARKKAEHALRERVKELRCLFELSRIVEREGISLEEVLRRSADLLPPAWQFPESTVGRITFHDLSFETADIEACVSRMSQDLILGGAVVGAIEVGYLDQHPPADEGPFLREERELLSMLAERLRHVIERKRSEEALRESEQQYRLLAENTLDVIWAMNAEMEFTYVNPAITRLTGYTQEEYVGTRLPDHFAESTFTELAAVIEQEIAKGADDGGTIYETELLRKDGTPVSVEVHGKVIFDEEGRPAGFHGTTREITERKRIEQALRDSEARYRALTQSANDAIITANDAGEIVGWNQGAEKLFGFSEAEAMGRPVTGLMPSQYEIIHMQGMSRLQSGGEPHIVGETVELEGRRKDGTSFPIELSLSAWELAGGTFYTAIIRDISERKRAEAERERLLLSIEQAAESIIITDTEGAIQYVNPAFERITGFDREEVLGENPRVLKSGEHDAAFYGRLWDTLTSGNTWRGRIVNKRKDGSHYTADGTISPVRDKKASVINYVAAMRDITEALELEQQLRQAQKMDSVGRLAGGVAHDFNNTLSVILGNAELALEELEPSDPLHAELQEIHKAAQRSADLTRQLLAFARKQTIAPKTLDLNDTIAGMLKMLGRLIGENIQLHWKPATNLWAVKMDPGQVDQVLVNLIVNARDAIGGVGSVSIQTGKASLDEEFSARHPGAVPGDYVMLAISDDGAGMDKKTLANIFEPFFTTKAPGRGTGLGLATVYGIVKQNNGFISVYSEPREGTTFQIYVPRVVGETGAEMDPESGEPEAGTETVLVVEDEPSLLALTRRHLERLGYNVLTADTPSKALELVRKHPSPIHLVLTDVVMPGMSGRELSRRLAELRPGVKSLYMSGYTEDAIAHRGVLDPDVHFLQKPFTVRTLAAKLREALED